jgi:(p)ppGpp synthase/HD superfamily hydrolase
LPLPSSSFTPSFIDGLSLARSALAYARELHQGQQREFDEAPFILHPLEVAALLFNTGHGEPVVVAAILHDTVEDTSAELAELSDRFGSEVARLVEAVTEDPGIEDLSERKAALRRKVAEAGPSATSVYAADKVAKVRELRARLTLDPGRLRDEAAEQLRLEHYRESLVMLEEITPEHPLVRQLRFELEALQGLPPRPAHLSPLLDDDRL